MSRLRFQNFLPIVFGLSPGLLVDKIGGALERRYGTVKRVTREQVGRELGEVPCPSLSVDTFLTTHREYLVLG